MSFVSLWGRERINQFGQWFTFTVLVSVHLAPHLTNIQGSVTVQKRFNYSLDLHSVWCKNNKAQFLTRRITNAPLSMPIYGSNTVLSVTILVWYINYRCLRKTFRSFAENIRLYHFRRLRSLNNKTKWYMENILNRMRYLIIWICVLPCVCLPCVSPFADVGHVRSRFRTLLNMHFVWFKFQYVSNVSA